MKRFFSVAVVLLLLLGCGKDTFETKPQLKIKSVSSNEVSNTRPLSVTIEFTDKEGDVSDSFFIVRQRLNANGPGVSLPFPYKIPNFPKTPKGEITVTFDYFSDLTLRLDAIRIPNSSPTRYETDTLRLKFVARDQAGNTSDTATLDNIFVERL